MLSGDGGRADRGNQSGKAMGVGLWPTRYWAGSDKGKTILGGCLCPPHHFAEVEPAWSKELTSAGGEGKGGIEILAKL